MATSVSGQTVPLLTGGLATTTGSGTATAQRTDQNGNTDQQSVQLGSATATYLADLGYIPYAPMLSSDQYPPSSQSGVPGAVSWSTDLGTASEDFSSPSKSVHCDYQLKGNQPSSGGYPAGGLNLPPFSNIDSTAHTCSDGSQYASSLLATYVADQVRRESVYDRAADPAPAAQSTQQISINEPVASWDCTGQVSCSSNLTWSGTITVHCMLCVTDISLKQVADPTSNSGALTDVPDTGTYDGNRVEITATVQNVGTRTVTTQVNFVEGTTHRWLPQAAGTQLTQPITFPAGATTQVTFEWDTSGYAWESGQPHHDRQIEVLTPLGGAYRDVTVLPKPVVLVHGFWSNADAAWADMKPMFARVDPDWNAYAVGDNPTWSPAMNTDPFDGASIDANAFTLGQYVEALRKSTGAQHIDLVGHSMGGLISRDYIDKVMASVPQPPGNRPVVTHLVMLGTPNQGSPCAYPASKAAGWFGSGTPSYQLRPDFITGPFNGTVTHERGVKLSVLAGTGYGVCGMTTEGDGVVSVTSAWWHYTDVGKIKDKHTDLTSDDAAFTAFVEPHLTLDPTQAQAAAAAPSATAATGASATTPASPSATTSTVPADTLQTALVKRLSLTAGARNTVQLTVATGTTRLEAIALAPATMGLKLTDPTGHVVVAQTAGSSAAQQPFRTLAVSRPKAGRWTLTTTATAAGTAMTTLEVAGSIPVLTVHAHQTTTGPVIVTAALARGTTRYTDVAMTARVRGGTNTLRTLTLRDDGHHHDGKAHDGIYGAATTALPIGTWFAVVEASRTGLTRFGAAVAP